MAVGKEIKTKIASVQSTQKITRAMEMVAASKMRKTQERVLAARPYAKKMAQVIRHLAQARSEYKHPYLAERDVKRVGVLLVSSDRGLCGGLNSNLFRKFVKQLKVWDDEGIEVVMASIGSKGEGFLGRLGGNVNGSVTHLGESPSLEDIIGVVKGMLNEYDEGNIDRFYIAHNDYVNTMTQSPEIMQLLPVVAEELDDQLTHHWDYIYEPDAQDVLDQLLIRYIESLVYQGVLENNACEQAARMVAMKSASDNAGELIDELQLIYNKARQASITQELSEIVAGAAAV
ncbi:MAG: F0F1 ATP synthase subunit gamma [Cycloclasticus sp. symbiont of Bathymodiolus heckerae]|nr:MAG: F0F1 ATP synthase subunit gamma [Cycloclasticus sp. symbiont of Bathymodiolus heckerae]